MPDLSERARPLTDEECEALPVFPLPRVVFFPGTTLPLHLFEPRYRDMMEDCLAKGPMAMAIVLLDRGWEADYDGRPAIHRLAGAGRIVEHRKHRDGRFDILLHGVGRVKLEELPHEGLSYRRALATPTPDRIAHPEAIDKLVLPVLATAASVTALVRQRIPTFELGVDASTPPGVLADKIADRLVPEMDRRQALLEAVDVKRRLALAHEALVDLLARMREGGLGGTLH